MVVARRKDGARVVKGDGEGKEDMGRIQESEAMFVGR